MTTQRPDATFDSTREEWDRELDEVREFAAAPREGRIITSPWVRKAGESTLPGKVYWGGTTREVE